MKKYIRKTNCKCFICQKDIYRRPKQITSGPVYCGNSCYGKSNEILIKCAICDSLFKSGLNKKTCSRKCANKQKEGLKYKQIGKSTKDKVKDLDALRKRLTDFCGYKCRKCKYNKLPILNIHHIIEKSLGGTEDLNNLEFLCPNCHAEEHYLRREQKKMEAKLGRTENSLEN